MEDGKWLPLTEARCEHEGAEMSGAARIRHAAEEGAASTPRRKINGAGHVLACGARRCLLAAVALADDPDAGRVN